MSGLQARNRGLDGRGGDGRLPPPHGWCNWRTASVTKCYDCANDRDPYETYVAGRIEKEYPGWAFMKFMGKEVYSKSIAAKRMEK